MGLGTTTMFVDMGCILSGVVNDGAGDGATGALDCTGGATRALDCTGGATRALDCTGGATRALDCTGGATGALDCTGGAIGALDINKAPACMCKAKESLKLQHCMSGETTSGLHPSPHITHGNLPHVLHYIFSKTLVY